MLIRDLAQLLRLSFQPIYRYLIEFLEKHPFDEIHDSTACIASEDSHKNGLKSRS